MDINEIIDMIKALEGQLQKHEEKKEQSPCPAYCWCHWLTSAKTSLEIALRVDYDAANNARWTTILGYQKSGGTE